MAYIEKRIKALEMRKQGMSYSMIKNELHISKSTLSLWLRNWPLSPERIRELSYGNEQRIEKYRNTRLAARLKRLTGVYENEKMILFPMTNKELYIAGLMLYWGEGGKTLRGQISISNTDPKVINFFIQWARLTLGIKQEFFRIKLHLYMDMDQETESCFWSNYLNIPLDQFSKPYIKKTTLRGLTYKSFGHGTCNVIIYGTNYYEKVMMGIWGIAHNYLPDKLKLNDKIHT